jgi:hypothetical protein
LLREHSSQLDWRDELDSGRCTVAAVRCLRRRWQPAQARSGGGEPSCRAGGHGEVAGAPEVVGALCPPGLDVDVAGGDKRHPKWPKVAGWTKALLAFKIQFGDRLPD